MFLQDYHTHTFSSYDGHQTPDTLISEWAKRGVTHLAITDHADFVSDITAERQLAFQRGIFGARQRWYDDARKNGFPLELAMGVEIGEGTFCREAAEAFEASFPFDFIIGSYHHSDGEKDPSELDFRTFDYLPMLDRYFSELPAFVRWGKFDVMGHITYPFRQMCRQGIKPPAARYADAIKEVLRLIIETGKGIEINTSPIFEGFDPMPDLSAVKLYRELGGEIITVGTDDHATRFAPLLPQKGAALLKEAGFNYFTTFSGRKPAFVKI